MIMMKKSRSNNLLVTVTVASQLTAPYLFVAVQEYFPASSGSTSAITSS
jgi:hypothetical protein